MWLLLQQVKYALQKAPVSTPGCAWVYLHHSWKSMHADRSVQSFSTCNHAVPLPLGALDESFHPLLPSTVSAPILDSKTRPGSRAQGSRTFLSQLYRSCQVCSCLRSWIVTNLTEQLLKACMLEKSPLINISVLCFFSFRNGIEVEVNSTHLLNVTDINVVISVCGHSFSLRLGI